MHTSAYKTAGQFFKIYATIGSKLSVLEIGSQNVNGTLRDHITPQISKYTGVDFVSGNGVDIVLEDPYKYPFPDNHFDIVVTSSCLEHSELFWLTWLEAIRVLKPSGILYTNAPSAWMDYHRYPVDCWRFWPDAAKALETWGQRNGYSCMTLETFIVPPAPDQDNADWASVFLKDSAYCFLYQKRIIDTLIPYTDFMNGFRFPNNTKFPHGWEHPVARYHMATKKNNVIWTKGLIY